jgi:hypothetical protein
VLNSDNCDNHSALLEPALQGLTQITCSLAGDGRGEEASHTFRRYAILTSGTNVRSSRQYLLQRFISEAKRPAIDATVSKNA